MPGSPDSPPGSRSESPSSTRSPDVDAVCDDSRTLLDSSCGFTSCASASAGNDLAGCRLLGHDLRFPGIKKNLPSDRMNNVVINVSDSDSGSDDHDVSSSPVPLQDASEKDIRGRRFSRLWPSNRAYEHGPGHIIDISSPCASGDSEMDVGSSLNLTEDGDKEEVAARSLCLVSNVADEYPGASDQARFDEDSSTSSTSESDSSISDWGKFMLAREVYITAYTRTGGHVSVTELRRRTYLRVDRLD